MHNNKKEDPPTEGEPWAMDLISCTSSWVSLLYPSAEITCDVAGEKEKKEKEKKLKQTPSF